MFPSYPLEWWGNVIFAIVMSLCNIGGIGGGGIHIPMIMVFYKFPTKEAVAISSLTIVMSAGTKYLYYWRQRNPNKMGVVVVDYGLATIMMPTTLAGSQIGT